MLRKEAEELVLGKLKKLIMWLIETFKVAISIGIVIIILVLVGCANLESLVHKQENVSRETSLIRIGEEKEWPTEKERVVASVSMVLCVKVGESKITMEVVEV
jgi:hypothetical protein